MNKTLYSLALASLLALGACSSEDLSSPSEPIRGKEVHVTLTVDRSFGATRTIVDENDDRLSLSSEWVKDDDQILVVNSENKKVGTLTIESIDPDNHAKAVFVGPATLSAEEKYTLVFLGGKNDNGNPYATWADGDGINNPVAAPDATDGFIVSGALADLSRADLMTKTEVEFAISEGTARPTADVQLVAENAMAHFSLSGIPTDATDATLTVNYGNVSHIITTIAQELYLPMPTGKFAISFRLSNGNDSYSASVNEGAEVTVAPGKYYTAMDESTNTGKGVEIELVKDAPAFDIVFMKYPEGSLENEEYNFKEDKSNPAAVPLPGNPDDKEYTVPFHNGFLGWDVEGGNNPETETWDASSAETTIVLYPVYDYKWKMEWYNGYEEGVMVPRANRGEEFVTAAGRFNIKTPYGLSQAGYERSNPERDGYTFTGWYVESITSSKTETSTISYDTESKNIAFEKYVPKVVKFTAQWEPIKVNERHIYITYHWVSRDPDHSNSGDHTSYNAMKTDRVEHAWDGYEYGVRFDDDFFNDQNKNDKGEYGGGIIGSTDGKGNIFVGWRKCVSCSDDYTAEDANRLITKDDNKWEFNDGKVYLHLEAVYEPIGSTTSPSDYGNGGNPWQSK